MDSEEFKPTLAARLRATALLLDRESPGLVAGAGERAALMRALQAGWRQVMRIKARAAVASLLAERTRRQPG